MSYMSNNTITVLWLSLTSFEVAMKVVTSSGPD